MLKYAWLILLSGLAIAQQQVVPAEFSPQQKKLFEKITVAISAPCCTNGVPVAYHDSPVANQIRAYLTEAIASGQSEAQIMSDLKEMRFAGREIIFTVPSDNSLGVLFWLLPALFIAVGCAIIFWVLTAKGRPRAANLSDDELVDRYRDSILRQVETPAKAAQT